ncbi:piezo-type mechanosensitive ion channel component 1-like [Canis lupus baileyi]|uniref:piezo-type mechanosensitive ion channel component 1-like n=1 Tax=Canis lupus baileyi TaxID=143281 RepID=UPI003B978495
MRVLGLEIFPMAINIFGLCRNVTVNLHGYPYPPALGAIAGLWANYCLFLILLSPYQCLLCLGIAPTLHINYLWHRSQTIRESSTLNWLYPPNLFRALNSTNLLSDFLLLLCTSQQWQVFSSKHIKEGPASIPTIWNLQGDPNPIPSFTSRKSYHNKPKVVIFCFLFWLMLVKAHSSIFKLGQPTGPLLPAALQHQAAEDTCLPPAMGLPHPLQARGHHVQEHALILLLGVCGANAVQLLLGHPTFTEPRVPRQRLL